METFSLGHRICVKENVIKLGLVKWIITYKPQFKGHELSHELVAEQSIV